LRVAIVEALLARHTRFRFAARASLDMLCRALPVHVEARLVAASHVEPAAIDLPDVTARACELRALVDADSRGFVVTVGRLVELKRIDLVLEAATVARVPIVIVGDGPARSQLEHLARASGARVSFVGLVSRYEALAWIAASSLLVHGSQAEAAPTVVREARALGVPVVACAAGDLVTWARTDPGIVVAEPSRDALANAIDAALAGRQSRNRPDPTHNFR
jgi:teichuronic acid biosynthesis glycosyltransferase TuaC